MSDLLPPFHRPMHSDIQCHLANDRIAQLEILVREYAERLRELWKTFDGHVQASSGVRKHTWMDALRYVGASPTKGPSEPDCDNCPQPHDEYNEPDCDACDAAWTARSAAVDHEMVPARGPLFGDGVWERRQDNPPGVGLINDVIPPDRVSDE